jgi:hypothetical protein
MFLSGTGRNRQAKQVALVASTIERSLISKLPDVISIRRLLAARRRAAAFF